MICPRLKPGEQNMQTQFIANKKDPDLRQGLGFLVLKAGLEPARALLPTGF